MNRNAKEIETPCDPASTRRPSVSGPAGGKLATEGGGGAGPRALPAAVATGAILDVATPGPSTSTADPAGPVPSKTPRWKKKRLALRMKADRESTALSTGGAVLDPRNGNGRGAVGVPSAQAPAATGKKSTGHLGRRQRIARRLKVSETMNKILTERVEGFVYPGDLAAIAPAVATVMSRSNPGSVMISNRHQTCAGEEGLADATAGTGQDRDGASVPSTVLGQCGDAPRTALSQTNSAHEQTTDTDATRQAKRQRSSDFISPSSATAEKRACLERGAARGPKGAASEAEEAAGTSSSYANAARSHLKVVILDKSGLRLDVTHATLLRKHLEERFMRLYLEDRLKREHKAPRFEFLPKMSHGGLGIEACNDRSLQWLVDTVSMLPPLWQGAGELVVVPQHQLPKYHKGVIFVPDCNESPEFIRNLLSWCNDDVEPTLDIDKWPIFVHKTIANGAMTDNVLVFGIPVEELPALESRRFRLAYKLAHLFITVRAPKVADVRTPVVPSNALETPSTITGESGAGGGDIITTPDDDGTTGLNLTEEAIDKLLSGGGLEGLSGLNLHSPAPSQDDEFSMASSPGGSLSPNHK